MSDFHDLFIPNSPITEDVILRRYPDRVETNVHHLVTHHSPTGYEWGYEGSGSADLALNILEAILRAMRHDGPLTECYKGSCFRLAWQLHQDFKHEFIDKVPHEGGVIHYPAIVAWITDHAPDVLHKHCAKCGNMIEPDEGHLSEYYNGPICDGCYDLEK